MVDKITSPITPLGEIDKINEIIDNLGSGSIDVDSALSTTSENPVQNKVITTELNKKGTVKSVNSTQPDANGNVTISIPTVPLEGVQINGSDLTITSKKVNIPLAGTDTIGVAGANAAYGIYNNGSSLTISRATDTQVTEKTSLYKPLTPSNIDLAVKLGITTNRIPLTDAEKVRAKNWLGVSEGGSSRNIGEIVTSTIPLTDAGLHLLDGALISGSGVYSAFVTYIAGLRTQYSSLFTTESDWQSTVTQYGVCGKFVYNSTNNTVRLPKYSDKIYTQELNTTAPVVGNGMTLGMVGKKSDGTLVNFGFRPSTMYNSADSGVPFINPSSYGTPVGTSVSGSINTLNTRSIGVTTDATKSGLVAQLSNITTSLDGYYYIVIATSTKTDIQVDIDEIATDLNGKADRDGSNMVSSVKNFDGQWVQSRISLVSNANVTSVSSYDLSSYLPNDDYKYEVILTVYAFTGKTSGNTITCFAGSDLFDFTSSNFLTNAIRVVQVRTRTSSNMSSTGTCIIPVGSGRVIKLLTPTDIVGTDNSQGTIYAEITGYRRIGTNN